MELDPSGLITDVRLLVKSLSVMGLTILAFFLHQALHLESAAVALAGASSCCCWRASIAWKRRSRKWNGRPFSSSPGCRARIGLAETGVMAELAARAIDLTGGTSRPLPC